MTGLIHISRNDNVLIHMNFLVIVNGYINCHGGERSDEAISSAWNRRALWARKDNGISLVHRLKSQSKLCKLC